MTSEGTIVKAVSGYYYVKGAHDKPILQCRARGIFKKRGIQPKVGDRVLFEPTSGGEGWITEIHPRSVELIRPPVANVDRAVLMFSVLEPKLNMQLLDKFLVHVEQAHIEAIIVLSKTDLLQQQAEKEAMDAAVKLYESIGYPVYQISAIHDVGLDSLLAQLSAGITVFAGQSGVGKSTLVNALIPGVNQETAEISQRLGRGRHTTRHVELIPLGGERTGFVVDTPGFSQLDFLEIEPAQLGRYFVEFKPLAKSCKFRACLHLQEPECEVREALLNGEISLSRYEHYTQFVETLIEEEKRRY